ncbi:MauE/DoxX family redox-associated membrane protein [Micromonospora sp. NPDC050276]|uniref:MauE/DoxX family redox-associated membrane protein n=1 Tax=Micromonospora sp. NPDC050276 TaxID=3364278 RepID=UPI0037AE485F
MSHAAIMSRWVICFTFAIAVAGKLGSLRSYKEFSESLDAWFGRNLPKSVRTTLAGAVITAELAVVALTAFDGSAIIGLLLAIALLLSFTLAMVIAVRMGRQIVCNCFGRGAQDVSTVHFVRNGIILIISGVGAVGADLGTSSVLPIVLALVIGLAISRIEDIGYLIR